MAVRFISWRWAPAVCVVLALAALLVALLLPD